MDIFDFSAAQSATKRHSTHYQEWSEGVSIPSSEPRWTPKPLDQQIMELAHTLRINPTSALKYAKKLPTLESFVPSDSLNHTRWYAVPSESRMMGRHFPWITDRRERHSRAIGLLFDQFASAIPYWTMRDVSIRPERFQIKARTASALEKVAAAQAGDILIIPAKFGELRYGCPSHKESEVLSPNEFALDMVTCCSIVLMHPGRFACSDESHIILAGDDFQSVSAIDQHDPISCLYFGVPTINGIHVSVRSRWECGRSAGRFYTPSTAFFQPW